MADVTDRDREQAESLLSTKTDKPFTVMSHEGMVTRLAEEIAQVRESAFQMGYAEAAGKTGKVRVLRMIEYVYPDAVTMVRDMANWGVQGLGKFGQVTLNSVVLAPEVVE